MVPAGGGKPESPVVSPHGGVREPFMAESPSCVITPGFELTINLKRKGHTQGGVGHLQRIEMIPS